MDTSWNPASLKYTSEKFNYKKLEDTSEGKLFIHQEHANFSVMLSAYSNPETFQEAWHHEYP